MQHNNRRYSEMNSFELHEEIRALQEKARKAEQMGMVNEYAVYERKVLLAEAYLRKPEEIIAGKSYEIEGNPGQYFYVNYLNGVFAWGYRFSENSELEGIPTSLLRVN